MCWHMINPHMLFIIVHRAVKENRPLPKITMGTVKRGRQQSREGHHVFQSLDVEHRPLMLYCFSLFP